MEADFKLLDTLIEKWGVKEFIKVKPYGWNTYLQYHKICTCCGKR